MSCSYDDFLQKVVPDVLRGLYSQFHFAVIGTRAINLYLTQATMSSIETMDWDIAIPTHKTETLKKFSNAVSSSLKKKGYKVELIQEAGTHVDDDLFSFRSRDWIRLTADVCGTQIVMLDVYQVPSFPETMAFIEHDGLLYSDMGFLIRELNRSESNAKNTLAGALKLTETDVQKSLEKVEKELEESGILLDGLRDGIDQLIESYGQIDDKVVDSALKDEMQKCDSAKKILMRVLKERELLFAAAATGKLDKAMMEPVCQACREYEGQYNQYTELKAQCSSVSRLCMGPSRSP